MGVTVGVTLGVAVNVDVAVGVVPDDVAVQVTVGDKVAVGSAAAAVLKKTITERTLIIININILIIREVEKIDLFLI